MTAGVLRIEVHYARGQLKLLGHTGTDDPLDIPWLLMQESKPRILKPVEKCYPQLDYFVYDKAQIRVEQSSFKPETRKQMLTLLIRMQ